MTLTEEENQAVSIKAENKFVYLMKGSKHLANINSADLKTDTDTIINSYKNIISKYDVNVQNIINRLSYTKENNNGTILNSGGQIISFCYWCDCLDKARVIGVKDIIEHIKKDKTYEEILHDVFVSQIAYNYKNYNVQIHATKNAKGADLTINNLDCECKTRKGYLYERNQDLIFHNQEEKSLNELAETEDKKTAYIAERAFDEQNADVVFVDCARTYVGFLEIVKSLDDPSCETSDTPPKIEKYFVVFYINENGKELWKIKKGGNNN